MPINTHGTGVAVFIIKSVQLVSSSNMNPDTGLPETIPLALVEFSPEPSGDPGVTVAGGFTVTSPEATPFIVGEKYNVTIAKQVTTP